MKIITFYQFDTNPRFPPFLLYVRCKFGVTFVQRCFRDEMCCLSGWLACLCFVAFSPDSMMPVYSKSDISISYYGLTSFTSNICLNNINGGAHLQCRSGQYLLFIVLMKAIC